MSDFPTRTTKDSSTAIDNIFLDYSILNTFQVFPVINGLSDHDAQYLIVYMFSVVKGKRINLLKEEL
jgi:hypothetical protein